jgi:hypothetical protein
VNLLESSIAALQAEDPQHRGLLRPRIQGGMATIMPALNAMNADLAA